MSSLVSIIVPVYNTEEYVSECVNSISNQSFRNIEIILVDDGSTDKSGEICNFLAKKDDRIIVIHQSNKGVSAARNVGISVASGYWIMFVDSDDWIEPDTIKSLLEHEDSGMDILAASLVKSSDRLFKEVPFEKCFNIREYKDSLFGTCLVDTERFAALFPNEMRYGPKFVYSVAKLYKLDVLKGNSIFFQDKINIGEDQIFNINVLGSVNGVLFINKKVYHYRIHENSACNNTSRIINNYIDYLNFLDSIEIKTHKYDIYKIYRKYDIIKSIIVVMAYNSKGWNSIVYSCGKLKQYIKKTNSRKAIKSIRINKLENNRDKFIVLLLKARLYITILMVYQMFFVLKRRKSSDIKD